MPPNAENETSALPKVPGKGVKGSKKTTHPPLISKENPPFTVSDLKKAIPAHCFQPTLVESFSHLFKDLLEGFVSIALVLYLDKIAYDTSLILWVALWGFYVFMQGSLMMGVWVIAHECGHGAFSTNDTINDIVGFVLHTCVGVPYFSWQRTHANHHHYTNNLQKDEAFVPARTKQEMSAIAYFNGPVGRFFRLSLMLLIGWPCYLVYNAGAHAQTRFASHYLPGSPIFTSKDYYKVIASTVGLIAWWGFIGYLGSVYGYMLMLRLYVLPHLVNNAFLVAITFMQHSDKDIPHYDSEEWTWLRGALCTVDRTMGSYLDNKLHLIHVTHVLHHTFSRVPFYRSREATEAMLPILGKYYVKDDSNFLVSMWESFRDCSHLENGKGVLYWFEEN